MHDLVIVAVLDQHLGQGRARHDLEIALHRDPRGIEPKLADQRRNGGAGGHAAMLAVDLDAVGFGFAHLTCTI